MADPAQALYGRMAEDPRPAVKNGALILQHGPEVFPSQRRCRDGGFVALFVVTLLVLAVAAWMTTDGLSFSRVSKESREDIPVACVFVALLVSLTVSCVLSTLFVWFTKICTKFVVWGTLLFSPCLMLVMALSTLLFSPNRENAIVISFFLAAPAALSIFCIWCCWRPLIPFTVEVLHAVASVVGDRIGVAVVGATGAIASLGWTMLASAAVIGAWSQAEYLDKQSQNAVYFVVCLILFWGGLVFLNACHVTYCGIVGRWYFGKEPSVAQSLGAALTTSFGSICLGSLIVAAIQAANALLERIRRQAREAGENVVVQCVLCLLQCMVRCVEDIAEALSYFSFVQVAVRGFGFIESVRVTYALCKFRNVFVLVTTNLIGSVVGIGALCCGVLSGFAGTGAGLLVHAEGASADELATGAYLGLALGSALGVAVSANILHALRSGFATICVCWAEDGERLGAMQPALSEALRQRAGLY